MLRISTAQSQDAGLTTLMRRQADLAKAQDRLTSGKRIARPSDDPAGAARAERALADQTSSEGLLRSINASRSAVSLVESGIGDAVDTLQSAREAIIQAGNGSYSASDRAVLANQLKQLRGQLLSIANSGDGTGQYIFGGLGNNRAPFVETAAGSVTFQGNAGQSQGSMTEDLPLSVDGQNVWMGSRSGNGVFETSRQVSTTSTAWISTGEVSDPSALALASGDHYELTFQSNTSYSVDLVKSDGSRAPYPNAASNTYAYASGSAITALPGISVSITGGAQTGDVFSVSPSNANLNPFDALNKVINALSRPATNPGNSGDLQQALNFGLRDVDQVLSNLQAARSSAGQTLNQLDGLESQTNDRVLTDQGNRSAAEDLDMAQGVSDFSMQQTGYKAALQSYSMTQKLSLFDYISN